jgi:phosphatidylserine/phosphatidylglycerophosphate/cardiolipin synthase-like enzyme
VKLIIQPGDSVIPLIKSINRAKKSLEVVIFRFDHGEIERALKNAASRGLNVHALIAYTNRGGERNLRKLEMRLLAAGVTVSRTGNDLARYHDKFMIVDRRELYVMAFNFTYLDIEHSRSFGVITKNPRLVQEGIKLFEADTTRQPYLTSVANFVVSPVNARKQLSTFLRGARKELLIYDPEISDPAMIRLLEERAAAGVEVRIIGKLKHPASRLDVRKLVQVRLHTRTILRDGECAFIGSQSLREIELEKRREVGIILRDRKVVHRLQKVFTEDWSGAEEFGLERVPAAQPVTRIAKKVAKAVAQELPPVSRVLEVVVKEVDADIDLNPKQVEETVKHAVKVAVKEAVKDAVEKVANGNKW